MTDVNTLGEFGLIDHLTEDFVLQNPNTIKGIGDDAAVIDAGDQYSLITSDMLVEGIHFDLAYTPLKHLGYKAVVVNLSDICAMNGVPEQIVVSIAISSKYTVEALEQLYEGIKLACETYHVDLIGGDTTSSPKGMALNITAIGTVDKHKVVYRNGAKPGDLICVTGSLGGAYLGLQILEREKQIFLENPNIQPDLDNHQYVVGRLLKPEARVDAIRYFDQEDIKPTSMIDISDGLASEIFHICKQSQCGAIIEESKLPMHPEMRQQAVEFGFDPITSALHGGEDYELLFTIDDSDFEKVQYMPDVSIIGRIVEAANGVKLLASNDKWHTLQAQGWNHFKA